MSKYETKTKQTEVSVDAFIAAVDNETKRADSQVLVEMMARHVGEPAKMWGPSIIGFGRYHYVYDSGHSGDSPRLGFSPRKASLTLYLAPAIPDYQDLLDKLGKHTTSVACLYIKRLSDIDLAVLEDMIIKSVAWMDERYPRD